MPPHDGAVSGHHIMPPRDGASGAAPQHFITPLQGQPVPRQANAILPHDTTVSAHSVPPRDAAYDPTSQVGGTPTDAIVRGWGYFFFEDMSPTPVFTQLMDSIFTYLDIQSTGHLTPEAYSRFLTNQGYVGQENTCAYT